MAKDEDANDKHVKQLKDGKKPPLQLVDDLYVSDNDTDDINQKFLEKMNEKHAFVCTVGGKPMVLCWTYSEVYKRDIVEFRSPDAIITQYNNESIYTGEQHFGKKLTTGLGKWWIAHPDRRQYDTVIFDPAEAPGFVKNRDRDDPRSGYWNLWEGFSVKEKKGCWKRGLKHIFVILCNRDPQKFKYYVRWLAHTLQGPGKRIGVCSGFKGEQGAGKGLIWSQLMKIFGRHGVSISNPEHLTGKHNAHLMLTCFLFADEAYYPGDKGITGILNQLITEEYLAVEPKFQNLRLSLNCLHIGMSTNAEWIVPATKDARRYFINAVDNKYAKGRCLPAIRKAYFEKVWDEFDNGGREAMLYDLLHMNLKDFSPENDVPETSEMKKQIAISLMRKEKHVQAFLENGVFPGILTSRKEYIVSSGELIDYMDKIDPGNKVPMRLKAEVLQKLGAIPSRYEGKRVWIFPKLGDMKKEFNKEICPVDWTDYEDWEARGSPNY